MRSASAARFSSLLCLCLAISALEHLLLSPIVFPIPGVKLGLSNLVILFCVASGRDLDSWILIFSRALINSLLFSNPISLIFSLAGGICSLTAMLLFRPLTKFGFTYLSLSVLGSLFFQAGQILVSLFLYGPSIIYYSPILLFCGIFTGILIGLVQNVLYVRLKKFFQSPE